MTKLIVYDDHYQSMWEKDWIDEMLLDCTSNSVVLHGYEAFLKKIDSSIMSIIAVGPHNSKIIDHLVGKSYLNIPFSLILLSDEELKFRLIVKENQNLKFILRNYISPRLDQDSNTYYFGLGPKNGLLQHFSHIDNLAASNLGFTGSGTRKFVWNFAGTIHNESRFSAINAFTRISPGFFHKTSHFNSSDYLSTSDYARVINSSHFTLCPPGASHDDSFRFYEALALGSIPVVLRSSNIFGITFNHWDSLFSNFGDLPFIQGTDWFECAHEVEKLVSNVNYLYDLHKKNRIFWKRLVIYWKCLFNHCLR